MAAKKAKAVPRPKKKQVPKVPVAHPYLVCFGGRNQFGPEHSFPTEALARNAIIGELNSWKPWCERYNNAGIKAIDEAIKELGSTTFHLNPARIECCFDEYSGMWLVCQFWTTRR